MLLAVDTSTTQMGLALYDGAQVLGEYAWRSGQRHTVELASAIADLLTRCAVTMDAVKVLGVALGPGSFTSLRVGLALVKGLALSIHIPLIGIYTLDILAHLRNQVPLLGRLEGTNVELGKKILRESGLKVVPADDLADAARKMTGEVKKAAA